MPRAKRVKKSNRRPLRKAKPSGAFRKKVLSIVHAQQETKEAYTSLASTGYKCAISAANVSFTRLVPNVAVGTADNQRIGDQVRVQSINWSGVLNMISQGTGQSDSVRRIGVRMMVLTPKSYGNWASSSANFANWQSLILKKGGIVTGFTGAIDDLFAPINTDAVTCHYNRVFKFTQGSFFQATGTNANGIVSYETSPLVKFFKHTFRFKNRQLKFDNAIDSGLTPTNMGMVIALGYCYLDGSAPDAVNRVSLQYHSVMKYEDS